MPEFTPDTAPDAQPALPDNFSDYLKQSTHLKPFKFKYEEQFVDTKKPVVDPAFDFTAAAAKDVGDAFINERAMPPEQHAANSAVMLNAPTVLHTTQAKQPEVPQPPAPDIMNADLPTGAVNIPKEIVELPTKKGGIETILPTGERVVTDPTEVQIKDIDARADETKGVKNWAEILGTTQKQGTIIRVDDNFKKFDVAWMKRLKQDNPTWTGEYLYLDANDKGKLVPAAYNPSVNFKTAQGANVGSAPDVNVGAISKKGEITDQQATDFLAKPMENEPWQTHALLKDNLPLAKFLMQHPDLMEAVNKSAEQMPSNLLASEAGRAQIIQKAVSDAYGGEEQVPTNVLQAVSSFNYYNAFKSKYQTEQQAISAKMKLVGENALKGVSPEMDEMLMLESKKLTDPASMSDDDRKRYARIKLDVTNAVIASGSKELPDLWNAYQSNQQSFISVSKQVSEDMQPLGTQEGQVGLNLYLKQKKGQELLRLVPELFPDVKAKQQKERELEEERFDTEKQAEGPGVGNKIIGTAKQAWQGTRDFGKSVYTGIVSGVDAAALGLGGIFGNRSRYYTAKLLSNGGSFEETPFAQTQLNKEGYKPFINQAGEMLGGMAPALLMGQFAKAPELAYFMLGTYNSGYQEAKIAGANELESQTIGAIKGGLVGLFMHTIQMPSDLAKATIGRMSVEDLVNTGFTKKGLTDYFSKFIPTAAGAKGVGLLNLQSFATQASDFFINAGANKAIGTKLPTDQMDINNIAHDVLLNTVVGSMIGAAAHLMPEAKGARMELLRNFNEDPALYAGALYEARKNAVANGDIKTLDALNKAHQFIANSWAKESKLPKGVTPEQKVTALSIWDEIAEQKQIKRDTDPIFHEPITAKIDDLHKQLKEVVASPEKAAKLMEKETGPVQEHLQETVLKPVEEIKPEVKEPEKVSNSTPLKERTSKISKEDFTKHVLDFAENVKDSSFEDRLDMPDMSQKEREKAVKDIREGRTDTKPAKKLQAHIDEMYNDEVVNTTKGRGNHVQRHGYEFRDWFSERTPEETDNDFSKLTPEQQQIAEQDYDTEQQLTDAYWQQHAETDGFAEKADNTKVKQDAAAADLEAKRAEIEKEKEAAPAGERPYHEQREKLLDKYGKDSDELIDQLKKEGRLEVKCPPGTKKRFSLRNLFKRK